MDIEENRQKRETLQRIEDALVERIVKSDEYLPLTVNPERRHFGSREYSSRENAFRRLETQKLIGMYENIYKGLKDATIDPKVPDLDAELASAALLDDDAAFRSMAAQYRLQSDAKGLLRFTCTQTAPLMRGFDAAYPIPENYGEFLYLETFYQEALANHETELSYREFLLNLPKDNNKLTEYLIEAYDRAHWLGPNTGTSAEEILASSSEPSPPLYCEYCQHQFTNANVYKGHLQGKKHKRAVSTARPQHVDLTTSLARLTELLRPQIEATVAQIDRKARMGLEDRNLEIAALENERQTEDEWVSDEELPSSDNRETVEVVRGPDGAPIPRWLFKLQGLGTTFRCEICGNAKFSGRRAFERHFNEPRHATGLAELGITMAPKFNGIGSVKEAQELAAALAQAGSSPEREVEDDEGNVMSERMYEDLKKQGLI